MCKKLMFLISFVALLGLVNVASAIDWIGTGSFCDPANWDGGVVPGPGDEARIECDSGQGDIVIDCDFTVNRLHGPSYESDCNQTMTIVSGTGLVNDRWRAAMEGDGIGTVDWTGGTITCDGEMRCNDDAKWRAYFNMSGSSMLIVNNRVRSGDSGGNDNQTHWSFTGDAIAAIDGYLRVGDDGGGSINVGGNASVTTGDELYIVCREMSATMDFSGNCEVYVGDQLRIGNPGQAGGKAPTTSALTMSGGTVNCRDAQLGWETYPDHSSTTVMTGGVLVCRDRLLVGGGSGSGPSTVSIQGGEIVIESGASLHIQETGQVDICGGTIKIRGNAIADVFEMVCDGSGRLTGCGFAAGVAAEFDGTYTVVTGITGVDPDQAYCPDPANGAERVRSLVTEVVLKWTEGECIGTRGRNIIFFGPASECEAVCSDTQGGPYNVGVTRAGIAEWNVGNLPLWECYCWKVDTFCQAGNTVTGNCWTFCTGCDDIPGDHNRDCLVNFIDYAHVVDDFGETLFWP
jgi:hypothetical protein